MIGALLTKTKARSVFEALNRRDIGAFMSNWAEDATFTYPGSSPVSGTMKGKPAITAWFQNLMDHFPQFSFNVKNVYVRDVLALGTSNAVVVELTVEGTNREGRHIRNEYLSLIRISRKKAVFVRDFAADTEKLTEDWCDLTS